MRVVHFLWSMALEDGGVVRALLDIAPALASAGEEVVVITCRGREKDVPADWPRVEGRPAGHKPAPGSRPQLVVIDPPGRLKRLSRRSLIAVRETLRGADVLHLHGMWMLCNDQVARIARGAGVPYVWSPHGMLDDWCMSRSGIKKRLYLALGGRSNLAHAAAVHCTAEAEFDQAGKWFPRERGIVVPLPLDLSGFRTLPGPEEAARAFALPPRDENPKRGTLLFLSRLDPKKGIEPLLSAVSMLTSSGIDLRLVIAGGGDERYVASLHEMVRALNLTDRVVFAGFVVGPRKVSLYQAADVFCLPTSQENFGYVVVEALASGTPVITTRGVALWPSLERERAAVLTEATPEALASALRAALADPAGSRAMGERGRAWCLNAFDPAKVIEEFRGMYRVAAARSRAPGQDTRKP